MAAALPPEGASLSPTTIANLEDELLVEETILSSLFESAPRDETTRSKILKSKKTISDLKQRLVQARGPTQGSKKAPHPESTMNSWGSYNAHNNASRLGQFPSTNLSPHASFGTAQRKRRFPSQFDDDDSSGPRTKSYRTTPSPMQTTTTTPSAADDFFIDDDALIDLTGDDEDIQELMRNQQAAFARLEQTKADERLAQELEAAPSPPENSQRTIAEASYRGPTAFDRILGRSSQLAGQSNSQSSQVSAKAGPPSSNSPRYTMPGSFDDEEEEEDAGFGFPMDFQSDRTETRDTSMPDMFSGGLSGSTFGQWPALAAPSLMPGLGYAPNVPAAMLAQQAANARQQGFASQNGAGAPSYAGPSGFMSTAIRPGMLQSGSYDPLRTSAWQPRGYFHNPNYNGFYNGTQPTSGDALSEIISQTNGINWASRTDALGNPLSDRIQGFYDDLQDDPRKTAEEIKDLLANIRPDEEIPEEDRIGTPEALRYPLYPHQQLALQWMMSSETGKNKGGILADDMGLGKTISTLALMVNRPSSDRVKTNLIVGPVALIKQWETEIMKKVKQMYRLKVLLLHGRSGATYEEIRKYDVVLTSYGKIGFEEKRYEKWIEQHPGADPMHDAVLAKHCPLIHPKSKFYRVILDEAQCIKNVTTLQAKGACKVNSVHRWCLTGTPMMNGVQELYSLIKFLKIAPYHNQKEFTKMFGSLSARPGRSRPSGEATRDRAMKALRALLKAIMLRRMKTSKLDGKPLLNLLPKTEEVAYAVFSEDEQTFYTNLESKTRITFNRYLRAGTVGKNYSNILVLLLRLRQACCHPHLNLDVEYVGNSEVTEQDMITLAKSLVPDVVKRLQSTAEEGFNCPICLDAVIDPTIVLPCGHSTCGECFATLVSGAVQQNLQAGGEGNGLRCPECRGSVDSKNVINLAAFKAVHMPETVETTEEGCQPYSEASEAKSDDESSESDSEDDDDENAGDVDRHGNLKDFIVNDDEELSVVKDAGGDENDDVLVRKPTHLASKKSHKRKSKSKGKAKAKEEIKPHMLKELRTQAKKNKADYKRYMKYLRKNWLPSAKVTECCRILQSIQESGDKTIVFSQFTFLLDLLEIPIKYELDINYCRYDGGMTRQQRDIAAQDFQDPTSRTKVMLVSLKAGNAGLNLTAANHVVIMDPFWNPYIENQAVDRAHRIGQQKPVQVHRLLVKETVEDRIIQLQEQKRQFVDAALDEGESKQLGRLSMQDLQYLFNGRD